MALTTLALVGGGWRAWASMHPGDATGPRAVSIGERAVSPVGWVTVTGVENVQGLTDEDLGGMSHGVTSLVDDAHVLVRVTVLLQAPAHTAGAAVTPTDFVVRPSSTGEPVEPVGGSLHAIALQAGEQVEGSLGFVLPRDGSSLVLQLVDGQTPPVTVDIGKVDVAPVGSGTHTH